MQSKPGIWNFSDRKLDCSKPVIMGIINVTPDSFSDGGKFADHKDAIEQAVKFASDGVDIIDIGGESTRPGSEPVSDEDELRRVLPVIEGIKEKGIEIPISIDTRKLIVAEKAVDAGAVIVNDVSALRDSPELGHFAAEKDLGLVLMHMLGRPREMQDDPKYDDVISEISGFFVDRLEFATGCGVKRENIVMDPGIGFGKLLEHNITILRECGSFLKLGHPVLIGPSRKRFIGEILDKTVDQRLHGTIGACVAAMVSGARIFRVHDVGPVKEALDVAWTVLNQPGKA